MNTNTNNSKWSCSPKQKLLWVLVILLGAQKPKIRITLRRANTEQLHSLNHSTKVTKFQIVQIVQAHGQIHGQDVHKEILKGMGTMSPLASHIQKWQMPRDYEGNGLPFRPKIPVTEGWRDVISHKYERFFSECNLYFLMSYYQPSCPS